MLALAACHKAPAPAEKAATQPDGRETPSGLPVPRYVATKFKTVNARSGPGDDYPAVWTYRARGLPLQVTAETAEWRRVCDPDGQTAWVHRRTVAEAARVMRVAATPLPLRARPVETARVTAELAARATASLGVCKEGWCKLTADKTTGWAPDSEVWGTSPGRQCASAGAKPAS